MSVHPGCPRSGCALGVSLPGPRWRSLPCGMNAWQFWSGTMGGVTSSQLTPWQREHVRSLSDEEVLLGEIAGNRPYPLPCRAAPLASVSWWRPCQELALGPLWTACWPAPSGPRTPPRLHIPTDVVEAGWVTVDGPHCPRPPWNVVHVSTLRRQQSSGGLPVTSGEAAWDRTPCHCRILPPTERGRE